VATLIIDRRAIAAGIARGDPRPSRAPFTIRSSFHAFP
jgi:hypothetical protein